MTSKQYAPVVLLAVLLHYITVLAHENKSFNIMLWAGIMFGFVMLWEMNRKD
jgi:hypothetical protein